jgi:hypothetical protein
LELQSYDAINGEVVIHWRQKDVEQEIKATEIDWLELSVIETYF